MSALRLMDGWLEFDGVRVAKVVEGLPLGILRRLEEILDDFGEDESYIVELESQVAQMKAQIKAIVR